MPKVTFIEKDGTPHEVDAPEHWSLMEVAVDNKIPGIDGLCGGSMACATCHCYIHPDWVARVQAAGNEFTEEEEDLLDVAFDVREGLSRLGCQVKLDETLDGLVVGMPGSIVGG